MSHESKALRRQCAWMVSPKSFSPLMLRRDTSGSLEKVASMLFANTKGLVYKPSSGISTGYSADKVSLDKNGKLFSDNLYNLNTGFVV